MSEQSEFVAHHVGGRAGSVGFPDLPGLADEILHVIYDADVSCVAQIDLAWRGRKALALPYCLWSEPGVASLHVNFDPYTSSLFPIAKGADQYLMEYGKVDYVTGEALRTVRTCKIQTHTLDDLCRDSTVPAPDFLSIDTQGAELAILRGARSCLEQRTIAVQLEVSFTPLYQNAPLFCDIDQHMRGLGFMLVDIQPFLMGVGRPPLEARGRTIPVQGETLYLLDPDSIPGQDAAAARRLEALAFAALAFGFTDQAIAAMDRRRRLAVAPIGRRAAFLYQFCQEVERLTFRPPAFHEILTTENSHRRFDAIEAPRLRQLLRRNPLRAAGTAAQYAANWLKARVKMPIRIEWPVRATPFETFLSRHGFSTAAAMVRKRRCAYKKQKLPHWVKGDRNGRN